MVEPRSQGSTTKTCAYDADDRLWGITVGTAGIAVRVRHLRQPAGAVLHGPGIDEPLAMSRGGSWYYYHVDGLGSVTMLTRADKSVANRYVYDDFGGFRSRTEAVTNPYAYTSREYDSAVDLIYYRARYYDPLIGRFLTRER